MLIRHEIKIDLSRRDAPERLDVMQCDENTREVAISLYNAGISWEVPAGTHLAVAFEKPDKKSGWYDTLEDGSAACSVEGSQLLVKLAPQMLTAVGIVKAVVVMEGESKQLTTFDFEIRVVKNPRCGAVKSTDYVNMQQWMLDKVREEVYALIASGDLVGPPGPQGSVGPIGPEGPQGVGIKNMEISGDGQLVVENTNGAKTYVGAITAYGIAVEEGFEGTVEEWLKSLQGEGAVTDAQIAEAVGDYMKDNPVTALSESVLEVKQNYFDPGTAIIGKIYKLAGDTILLTDGYPTMACGMVEVDPDKVYLLSRSDYTVYLVDENMTVLGSKFVEGASVVVNITEVAGADYQSVKYLAFSWKHDKCAVADYMVVDEATGLDTYISYDEPLVTIKASAIPPTVEVYHVGPNREFTTLTACLMALQGNENDKTIFVDAGEYDIFAEIGGADFCATIESGADWRDVSVVLPDNTAIVGLGEVVLKFQPTIEEIGSVAANLLSPLNIADNATIENITINSYNCRYAIHSDLLHWEGTDRVGLKQVYRNVRINHTFKNAGKVAGFGAGHWKDGVYIFENCKFVAYQPLSFHNNGTYTSDNTQIVFNDCVFHSTVPATYPAVIFGNVNSNQCHVRVDFNNCYLNSKIRVKNEISTSEKPNAFDITMVRSSEVEIEILPVTNIYTPTIYESVAASEGSGLPVVFNTEITEAVATFVADKDNNGEPFSLSHFELNISFPVVADAYQNGTFYINDGQQANCLAYYYNDTSVQHCVCIRGDLLGGTCVAERMGQNYGKGMDFRYLTEPLTSINVKTFSQQLSLPVGTKICLRGV